MKEIDIREIEGYQIGNAEIVEAGTGCTVILTGKGAVCGLDVRGGGPASRESALLNPLAANDCVNAVLLSGGSAFGLDAAGGVMKFLEEKGIGFPTNAGVVPIVCASCLFDLPVGRADVRPDAALGRKACGNAGNFQEGNYGAGCGASCGKVPGGIPMKSGIGAYAVQIGDLKIGAVAAANPMGNIVDAQDGSFIAGMHDKDGNPMCAETEFLKMHEISWASLHQNTTIGAVIMNAKFHKTHLVKIAGMAHDGLARAVRPVHTMFDGDSIYALANGDVEVDVSIAGAAAAYVFAKAVDRAALCAKSAYGLKGAAKE